LLQADTAPPPSRVISVVYYEESYPLPLPGMPEVAIRGIARRQEAAATIPNLSEQARAGFPAALIDLFRIPPRTRLILPFKYLNNRP